ncbi:dimethylsulfone monooxygenase SfnG [Nocardioides cavernaquae]|uniref:Dimethyl sulfone monooxygenase SfnG n=1 Tax=Nocardioides cavernaquae TaxID=2321396 RepID=A0A3A5H3J8_9ACTN|nr:dimethyl sulfone monooxygenase SfnG [Nocardioides cavernaquae]RJS45336.1 dimethyl sulfone monooxygenase SfnG [Nocardioides cavernaquae]
MTAPATEPLQPLQFAYWVPNVSGGLVVSKIEQRTDWGWDYNVKLAQLAENNGFDYALSQVRYTASYGADQQHESTSFSLGLLTQTERLKVIAAVHPYFWNPAVLAKWLITADHISGGRAAVNVVSGWFKNEAVDLGVRWLEHDERYRNSEEFIRVLRGLFESNDRGPFTHQGDFYQIHDFQLKPGPVTSEGRPHPEIFQGGNSTAARGQGGRVADWYFANGNTPEGIEEQIRDVTEVAQVHNRSVKFGVNGFLIGRESEAEARNVLREIIDKADREAVEGFGGAVKQAGQSAGDKKGMWQDSEFADLVQYNDGFRTGLVGTPEQIAHRMLECKKKGVNLFLLGFLHYHEDVVHFGEKILPIVRELEAAELARV